MTSFLHCRAGGSRDTDVGTHALLILLVGDVGLRVSLIGRLSLDGESIVTLGGGSLNEMVPRVALPSAILITDDDAIRDCLEDRRVTWGLRAIIYLAQRRGELDPRASIATVSRANAAAEVAETLQHWGASSVRRLR